MADLSILSFESIFDNNLNPDQQVEFLNRKIKRVFLLDDSRAADIIADLKIVIVPNYLYAVKYYAKTIVDSFANNKPLNEFCENVLSNLIVKWFSKINQWILSDPSTRSNGTRPLFMIRSDRLVKQYGGNTSKTDNFPVKLFNLREMNTITMSEQKMLTDTWTENDYSEAEQFFAHLEHCVEFRCTRGDPRRGDMDYIRHLNICMSQHGPCSGMIQNNPRIVEIIIHSIAAVSTVDIFRRSGIDENLTVVPTDVIKKETDEYLDSVMDPPLNL